MRTLPDPRVARLMYGALIADAADPVHVTASRAGISGYQLYAICEGRRHLLVERLRAILRALPADRATRLLSDLLDLPDLGLVVSEAPVAAEALTDNRRSWALKVATAAGDVAGLVDRAEADGVVTQQEHEAIEQAITALERTAETLRAQLHVEKRPLAAVRSGR